MSKAPKRPTIIEVRGLTAEDVVCNPMKKYDDRPPRHVKSTSIHPIWLASHIRVWDTFQEEVKQTCSRTPWEEYADIMDYDVPENSSKYHILRNDHFVCGEEISTSGRFVQHALNPMTAIAKMLGYNVVFGDWKSTDRHDFSLSPSVQPGSSTEQVESEKADSAAKNDTAVKRKRKDLIPGYALMVDQTGHPRAVGEAKTPWKHNFLQWWLSFLEDENLDPMRRALGQVGNYMIELELKYGFLTNYDSTFFLKREIVDGMETMFCSRPIPYHASHQSESISVRASLLFLQTQVQGDKSSWYVENPKQDSVIKQRKNETIDGAKERLRKITFPSDTVGGIEAGLLDSEVENLGRGISGLQVQEGSDSGPRKSTRLRQARFADPPEDASKSSDQKQKRGKNSLVMLLASKATSR